jgi:hypothetical protein
MELFRAFECFFLETFKILASHSDFSRVVKRAFSGDPGLKPANHDNKRKNEGYIFFNFGPKLHASIQRSIYECQITRPFFLKMPNIIFSVMQKPFIKCVIRQRVGRFLHSRKKLIRRFQKSGSNRPEKVVFKNSISSSIISYFIKFAQTSSLKLMTQKNRISFKISPKNKPS